MSEPTVLERLQAELRPWQAHNFPDRTAWYPLCGVAEELGELVEARALPRDADDRQAAVRDAVGDVVVFACDYATCMGWDFQRVWEERLEHAGTQRLEHAGTLAEAGRALGAYGRLAHHHLKAAQDIRGGRALHLQQARRSLALVMMVVDAFAASEGVDAVEAVDETWRRVKLRDWRARPDDADAAKLVHR